MTATDPSCPRCGAAAAAEASRCAACGFVFFELPPQRALPRLSPLWVGGAVAVLAGGVALVLALTRDPEPEPPAPVPAARAEVRLERQLDTGGVGPAGAVRCPGPIRLARATRCQFLYPDGDTQLMLVTITRAGELDIEVPYPAQRRP